MEQNRIDFRRFREVSPVRLTRHKEGSLSADAIRPSPSPSSSLPKATVLNSSDVSRAATRIAHEISERNHGSQEISLVALANGGVWLAEFIAGALEKIDGAGPPVEVLDVTPYRDDRPFVALKGTPEFKVPIQARVVILVDDVIFTGRTARAALEAINFAGRPRAVQLAVLVDRGHRELPIRPDYVGKNLPTSQFEHVEAGPDGVRILECLDPSGEVSKSLDARHDASKHRIEEDQ